MEDNVEVREASAADIEKRLSVLSQEPVSEEKPEEEKGAEQVEKVEAVEENPAEEEKKDAPVEEEVVEDKEEAASEESEDPPVEEEVSNVRNQEEEDPKVLKGKLSQMENVLDRLTRPGKEEPQEEAKITVEDLEKDPVGTIDKIATLRAQQMVESVLRNKIAPIEQDVVTRKTKESWKSFSDSLESSGIKIDKEMDDAIAKEIAKLPPRDKLIALDPEMANPTKVLEYAYYKASKKVKPQVSKKKVPVPVKKTNTNSAYVESSGGASTPAPKKVDPRKMPLADLEKLIGVKDSD